MEKTKIVKCSIRHSVLPKGWHNIAPTIDLNSKKCICKVSDMGTWLLCPSRMWIWQLFSWKKYLTYCIENSINKLIFLNGENKAKLLTVNGKSIFICQFTYWYC